MGQRRSVLLITEWLDDRFQRGVAKFAKEAGWHLALDSLYKGAIPWGWQGDGCLAMVFGKELGEFVNSLNAPVLDLSHNYQAIDVPHYHEDDCLAGKMAADYLLSLGFRNFAYYSTDRLPVAVDRGKGFATTVETAGHPVIDLFYESNASKTSKVWLECKHWLEENIADLPKPIAVFCMDDRLAANLAEVAIDAGIAVPDQLAIMGVGNLETACECSIIPITSIDMDAGMFGYRAAECLDQLMNGISLSSPEILHPPRQIIKRASTYTLATDDPQARSAIRYILDHYQENIGVDNLAEAVCVSRRKLNYIFSKSFGNGPAKVIEAVRLDKARQLLIHSDKKTESIAHETGFSSYLHFTRAFKRNHQLTPTQFRELKQGKWQQ